VATFAPLCQWSLAEISKWPKRKWTLHESDTNCSGGKMGGVICSRSFGWRTCFWTSSGAEELAELEWRELAASY